MQAEAAEVTETKAGVAKSPFSRFGWLANSCTLGSVLLCFSQPALLAVVVALGVQTAGIVPHVQAVLMWTLALLAVVGLALDRKRHGDARPLVIGIVSFAILVGTLYGFYHWSILTLSFLLLITAVFVNQTAALKGLYAKVQAQAAQLEDWNRTLSKRVEEQIERIERLDRLKRFLAPQVARLVTDAGGEALLASHRREIAALFCDLRGFTACSERIEPEEAMALLQSYHHELDKLIAEFNGTIDHRAGDGLMVIFNDPVPCDAPVEKTLRLALAMRDRVAGLSKGWRARGYDLGFGIGIASGYATLGIIGSEGRIDYTANGNVVNLASRLCDIAKNGQIVLSQKAYAEVENFVQTEILPPLELKGISSPVRAFNVLALR